MPQHSTGETSIDPKFDQKQLSQMKSTCQRHCFSTLNHNLAYCYNDARVIKWLWSSFDQKQIPGWTCAALRIETQHGNIRRGGVDADYENQSFLWQSILCGMMLTLPLRRAQSDREGNSGTVAAPVDPSPADVDEINSSAELLAHNAATERRAARLHREANLQSDGHNRKGARPRKAARWNITRLTRKTFVTTSESGSGIVRRMAFKPLIASEIEAASGKQHHDSAITPANYTFELLGEQQVGPYRCFVVRATPKRPDKYLFEGKVWIDTQDYAVVRIAGHPAKKLSFWIERVDFVREYQKIDGFWLSKKDETFVKVRMYGQKVLTIDHQNYSISAAGTADESVQDAEN